VLTVRGKGYMFAGAVPAEKNGRVSR